MTKLMQWLFLGVVLIGIWSSIITKTFRHDALDEYMIVIWYSPIILIVLFGIYAVAVVLWRVYTFNDCEDAVTELQQQIKAAKEDLSNRGFIFNKPSSIS